MPVRGVAKQRATQAAGSQPFGEQRRRLPVGLGREVPPQLVRHERREASQLSVVPAGMLSNFRRPSISDHAVKALER